MENFPDVLSSRRLNKTGPVIEFVRHEKYSGWTLVIDGFYHSNLDLDGEPRLNFDYAKRVVALTDHFFTPRSPISILHLGGGALSIPRYLEETRPKSRQVVIEIEKDVVAFAEELFPLPTDTDIEVIYADASSPSDAIADSLVKSFDLIVCDVYLGSVAQGKEATISFFNSLKDLLSPNGVLVINAVDALETQVKFAQENFLLAKEVFDGVALVADVEDLHESRKTNLLIVAGDKARIGTLITLESNNFGLTTILRDV